MLHSIPAAAGAVNVIDSDLGAVVTASVCTIQPVVAEEGGIALAIIFRMKLRLRLQEHQKASPALKHEVSVAFLAARPSPLLRPDMYLGLLVFGHILVLELLHRCWVDRKAKGRRLLLNRLLARDVRQMADVALINPRPAGHRLPANDAILAGPDLPNRVTGEGL
ncbi:hypothetical protein HPB47_000342 [Ixodes persulcatus]|uniref:Uncharacterized protein n=1 Tax=Ixodes persulcatus TaxID=34615 RepID=A0AC60PS99_IXOPE|nr:hypothetical protein HPB47_000342 [Ixodes persulcatus]